MSLDRDLVDAVRDLDEPQLRRLMMLARARLDGRGSPLGLSEPNVRFRRQYVKCGKASCSRCPHGPYWYAYWREEGRRRSCYLGRVEEDEATPPGVETAPPG